MHFTKGHGTQNDFLVLHDPDVTIELLRPRVAALCDRRRGLGADGILRVARAGALRDAGVLDRLPPGVDADHWFMDYRNGDGSVAEMCGNGVRVFAHYLRSAGLETDNRFVVGSRAGARPVIVHTFDHVSADVTVDMGDVHLMGSSSAVLAGRTFEGIGIDVGNPHLACVDPASDVSSLGALDLSQPPEIDTLFFTEGANVEVLTRLQFGRVDIRVFERGVGETRSCGTGTVAAAAAALSYEGMDSGQVVVGVPGGEVTVTIDDSGASLRGPSVLVGSGAVDDAWWRELA